MRRRAAPRQRRARRRSRATRRSRPTTPRPSSRRSRQRAPNLPTRSIPVGFANSAGTIESLVCREDRICEPYGPPSRSRRWISPAADLACACGSGGRSSSARCCLSRGCSGGRRRGGRVRGDADSGSAASPGTRRARFGRSARRPRSPSVLAPGLHDPDALAAEDLVERAAVLAVAVADQEADAVLGEVETEVARLLGNPGAAGILRAAGEPDAPARMRDEEEDVVAAQKHALDREEVAGDNARRLPAKELAPVRACPPRRRLQPCPGEQMADARRRDAEAELAQLAADPAMTPARILACERNTSSRTSTGSGGPPRRADGCRHFRRTSARCQRSSVLGVTRR